MSVYTNTARFDGTARALTEAELFKLAPSIFAVSAHESRSERFQPIPTYDVLKALMKEGFMPVGAKQSRSRDEGKKDFTKHLIRLRRLDDDREYRVGDTLCEILLKNANDGTSAYDLMAGLFRVRCTNSMVSQIGTFDGVKVRHSGSAQVVAGNVIEGTYRVLGEAQKALVAPADWSAIRLDGDERRLLARTAHMARFETEDGGSNTPEAHAIQPERFLIPHRFDDKAPDLWTTFNVIQENAIKGGMRGAHVDETGHVRRVTSRAVKGIEQDVKLNKLLFGLAAGMAALKGKPLAIAA